MRLHMGDTAYDLAAAAAALESGALALQLQQYGTQQYYPGGYAPSYDPSYAPAPGYAPAAYPPGSVAGGVNTTIPVIPVALGAAAGWYWKKSPLAAVVGAIAGFILGNIFGSVAVQSQVQATPLQPSNVPYGY